MGVLQHVYQENFQITKPTDDDFQYYGGKKFTSEKDLPMHITIGA